MNTQITTQLFTTVEAAKLLEVNPRSLYTWRKGGIFEESTHYIKSSWDDKPSYLWNVKAVSERMSIANNSGYLAGTKEFFLVLKHGKDCYLY
mgnify:CR=1 FL=1|tara:strand:+ start:80 stop:355 length:276 start_codon:yes stop_codon:yes gene_type:complete